MGQLTTKASQRGIKDPVQGLHLLSLRTSLADPQKLLELHDQARGESGRPKRELEVLKRATIILTVTSWETFIEGVLKFGLQDRLRSATNPKELRGTFHLVAKEWLKRSNLADHPERLAEWTGDGWRELVQKEFKSDLDKFHTPKSDGIRRMFEKYLEVDVTARWRWRGTTSQSACRQLDDLVKLRGNLTHNARGMYNIKAAARLEDAVGAIKLVERLAHCTLQVL